MAFFINSLFHISLVSLWNLYEKNVKHFSKDQYFFSIINEIPPTMLNFTKGFTSCSRLFSDIPIEIQKLFHLTTLLIFLNTPKLFSQSITPFALNNGGGYSTTADWSIGESVSIASFISPNYTLNTGLLQPLTSIVSGVMNYGILNLGDQISLGPNPTSSLVHFKSNFRQMGMLSLQVLDSKSTIILNHEPGFITSSFEKDISFEKFSAGSYYIRIHFKPISGISRVGVFKIIKL